MIYVEVMTDREEKRGQQMMRETLKGSDAYNFEASYRIIFPLVETDISVEDFNEQLDLQ